MWKKKYRILNMHDIGKRMKWKWKENGGIGIGIGRKGKEWNGKEQKKQISMTGLMNGSYD